MLKDQVQQIQEDEYIFPYHHIPHYQKYFNQCLNFSWGINYVATLEFLLEKLKNEHFESLVDVGCGDGRLTKDLKERFKTKDVEGIDYSERAIAFAKLMDNSSTYHCLDITKVEFDKKFDIAILMEVLEHIPIEDSDRFLDSVKDLIKENGVLLLTVPHINVPVETKHYRHFSGESILKCLENLFEVVEVIFFEKKDKRKKIVDFCLTNELFILNNYRLRNKIYSYYRKNLFFTDKEDQCKRIFVKAKLK